MRQRLARFIIRSAALLVLLVGLVRLGVDAADVSSHFKDERRSVVESLSAFLQTLDPALWLVCLGAVVCVSTRLWPAAVRPKEPAVPFDFQAAVGGYIKREPVGHRIWRRFLGTGLVLLAIVLGPCWRMVQNGVYGGATPGSAVLLVPVMLVLGIAVIVFRLRCLMAGLRRWAPRAETLLRFRHHRPVLYLRSFAADKGADPWEASSMFMGWLLGWLPETYERSLAKAVAGIGPLVAIGEPNERLPPLGAARLYVRDGEDWQRVVAELVRASQVVILRIGRTEGFWWEFKHLVAHCDPKKVIFYLPEEDRGALYSYLQDRAADVIPHPFPIYPGRALFIRFDPDWTPRLLGLRGPSMAARLRRLVSGSPAPAVREALNGALKRLGLNARRLPFQFREWVILGTIGLLALWVLLLFS